MAKAGFTRLASLCPPAACPTISRLQRPAGRQTQLRLEPTRTQTRSETMCVRGARPPDLRAAMLGSSASLGLSAWALDLALEHALTRPLYLMMRPMRRLEAQSLRPLQRERVWLLRLLSAPAHAAAGRPRYAGDLALRRYRIAPCAGGCRGCFRADVSAACFKASASILRRLFLRPGSMMRSCSGVRLPAARLEPVALDGAGPAP